MLREFFIITGLATCVTGVQAQTPETAVEEEYAPDVLQAWEALHERFERNAQLSDALIWRRSHGANGQPGRIDFSFPSTATDNGDGIMTVFPVRHYTALIYEDRVVLILGDCGPALDVVQLPLSCTR